MLIKDIERYFLNKKDDIILVEIGSGKYINQNNLHEITKKRFVVELNEWTKLQIEKHNKANEDKIIYLSAAEYDKKLKRPTMDTVIHESDIDDSNIDIILKPLLQTEQNSLLFIKIENPLNCYYHQYLRVIYQKFPNAITYIKNKDDSCSNHICNQPDQRFLERDINGLDYSNLAGIAHINSHGPCYTREEKFIFPKSLLKNIDFYNKSYQENQDYKSVYENSLYDLCDEEKYIPNKLNCDNLKNTVESNASQEQKELDNFFSEEQRLNRRDNNYQGYSILNI